MSEKPGYFQDSAAFFVNDSGRYSFILGDHARVASLASLSRRDEEAGLVMSGPSKIPPPFSGPPETVLAYVERLRRQAEEFHGTVEEELRTARTLLEELHLRQAKRQRHRGRRD